jgi:OHCU decarboxylase
LTRGLERLNALGDVEAEEELRRFCGSREWARRMVGARPFPDARRAIEAAERIWVSLGREDWLEAFRAHPRIGDRRASGREAAEQAGARAAPAEVLASLDEGNRLYEERFGHVFLVFATGKTGAEMLGLLRQRLGNDPETEVRIAADEQRKITRRRLEGALGD